jgi:hypothetical protein
MIEKHLAFPPLGGEDACAPRDFSLSISISRIRKTGIRSLHHRNPREMSYKMLLIPVPESLHSGIEIARTILFKPKARRVWFQWDR